MPIRMKSLKNSLVYASKRQPKDSEFDARGETDAKVLEFAKAAVRVTKPAAVQTAAIVAAPSTKGRGGARRSSAAVASSTVTEAKTTSSSETASGSASAPSDLELAAAAAGDPVRAARPEEQPSDGTYSTRRLQAEDE